MLKPVDLKSGDVIRHYKIPVDGGDIHRYVVLVPHAIDVDTCTDQIVYQALYKPGSVFVRPVSEVTDIVGQTESGEPIFRFMKETESMSLRLENISDIPMLFDSVQKCSGNVELTTDAGDRINLKSELSKKLLAANVFSHGDIVSSLRLAFSEPTDAQFFLDLVTQ